MSAHPATDPETEYLKRELQAAHAKLDSILATLMKDHVPRLAKLEQSNEGRDGILRRIEDGIDQKFVSLQEALFKDHDGISPRLRRAEERIVYHGVVVKALSVVAAALAIAVVKQIFFGGR